MTVSLRSLLQRLGIPPRSLGLLAAVPALLGLGCQISTPFRGPGYDRTHGVTAAEAGETVVVAVTLARLDADRRNFDENIWRVVAELEKQPGLIGYRVGKQLFGDEVRTLSIWVDEASLDDFLASRSHEAAIDESGEAIDSLRSRRVRVSRYDLPIEWERALSLLDETDARYGAR